MVKQFFPTASSTVPDGGTGDGLGAGDDFLTGCQTLVTWSMDCKFRRTWAWKAISCLSPCRSGGRGESGRAGPWLAWRVHEVLGMNERDLMMRPVGADQVCMPAVATERSLRICVVFDDEDSAWSAELLIRHVASGYDCEKQSFSFDELDRPAPVMAAARSASDADILMVAVRYDHMLPPHVKSWLGLCVGLRNPKPDQWAQ